ncbi:MAG: hypothetical protein QG668_247 [Patescibacteria group bacterium]|nr:hypothetical protein [Patescibacteria group bacterium]
MSCVLVKFGGELLEGAKRTSGNFHALTIDLNGLKVDVLTALGSTVGVAAGLAEVGVLPGKKTDARHIRG